jgi:hypothetical protein
MIKTLFKREFEISDYAGIYANSMYDEFCGLPNHQITLTEEDLKTDHGFTTTEKISLTTGIYLLYRYNELIYIGKTDNCLRNRIARFIAGVRGTERFDENHSAAYKYIEFFGRNLSGLSFKYIAIDPFDLEHGVTIKDIENVLIEKMRPMLNGEIYKDYRFQKILKITDTLGINGEKVVPL